MPQPRRRLATARERAEPMPRRQGGVETKDLHSRASAQGGASKRDGTRLMSECRSLFRARWNGGLIWGVARDGTRPRRVLAGTRTSRLPSDSPLFLRCPIFDLPDSSRDSVPSRPPSPALLAPLLRAPLPATGAFRRRPSKRSCASTSRRCAPATKRSCAAIPSFKASRHFLACGALGGEAAGHAVNAAVSRPPECAVAFVAGCLAFRAMRSRFMDLL